MEPKNQSNLQELRTVFAKSQLSKNLDSSQESLDLLTADPALKKEPGCENSDHARFVLEKNVHVRRSLAKPSISPKPSSLNQGAKPAIKNLVAALEGSHGMYTTSSLPKTHSGITVKDLRESSEIHKSPVKNVQITSKLVRKETIVFKESKDSSLCVSSVSSPTNKIENCNDCSDEYVDNSISEDVLKKELKLMGNSHQNSSQNPSININKVDQENSTIRETIISTDNYVCNPRTSYIRNLVPSKEELGPAPPKPPKPEGMRLPLRETSNYPSSFSISSSSGDSAPPPVPDRNLNFSPRLPACGPPKPPRALPKEPDPSPPSSLSAELVNDLKDKLKKEQVDFELEEEEEEEIYNDVIFNSSPSSPTCATAEDDDIYDDHSPQHFLPPSLPRHPPPPPPPSTSNSLFPPGGTTLPHSSSFSNMSNDSSDNYDTDAIYEEASPGPEYANTEEAKKEKKKQKKRSLKTEQKTLEKIEKKREKFMKKFSLSGEEIPLDAGTVKNDSKGNKYDLSVIKGETVLILRMENNPSGKWLVKNGNGRVGYVELTNIQVDVESVKSVMVARTSQIMIEEVPNSPSTD